VTGLDYGRFEALTFDCYGTLIDWESGILAGLRPMLARHAVDRPDNELLEVYAGLEAAAEAGPYRRYREILAAGMRGVAAHYGVEADAAEVTAFADSVGAWPPFPDSTAALATLHQQFQLGVITIATTTSSPDRRPDSRPRSSGSSPRRPRAATSPMPATSRSPWSASGCRASGSSMWPRASSTTT